MAARYERQDGAGAYPAAGDFLDWILGCSGDRGVACGGITRFRDAGRPGERSAELKWMYVVRDARG
jgi:hypothetical protein